MVEHLVGMQAQEPRDPYLGLWSRIEQFQPPHLEAALLDRSLVRMVAMRGTIHLLTASDALGVRHLFQPVLDAEMARHSQHKAALATADLEAVRAFASRRLHEPLTLPRLRDELAQRFPEHDPAALAFACRNTVPLVQAPPRGLWQRSGAVAYVAAPHWLGAPETKIALEDLVLRYLRAFGPATVADISTWTRLTGLRAVVDRLRPDLRTWRDEAGRELFDVPDGLIVGEDVDAPVRFLPEYDNVLLSHKDRSRVIPPGASALYDRERPGTGSVLVDGVVKATWWRDRDTRPARLTILHHGLSNAWRGKVVSEAERAVPLLVPGEPDAAIDLVRLD
jgi:hypothetical protein